jgi:hypothetical protein
MPFRMTRGDAQIPGVAGDRSMNLDGEERDIGRKGRCAARGLGGKRVEGCLETSGCRCQG